MAKKNRPGVLARIKLASQVFQQGLPSARIIRRSEKATLPFAWPTYQEDVPVWRMVDLASYIEEGFNLNTLIYSAVMYKARATVAAPLRAYRGDPDRPDPLKPSHPLAQLLARPNPYMSWIEFQQTVTVYLNIAGNCYVWLDRPSRDAAPTALWPLRPDRVNIIPAKGGIRGYLYVPQGKPTTWRDAFPILPRDLIHVKFPNAGDDFEGMGYGLSPLSPMARSADVDNMVTRYLNLFFRHGAMPQGLVKYDVPMDQEDLRRAKERWMEIYGGYENWSEPAFLDSGGEYQRTGLTFDEMGFESLDERNESRVLGPFGVPAALIGARVGLRSASVSANVGELRRVFWEDTLMPELALFETEFAYYLGTDEGEFVAYDYSKVPALRRDFPPLIEAAYKLWSMGVPVNTALSAVGIDIGEVPGGDVGYLPLSVLPVGAPPPAWVESSAGQETVMEDDRQEEGPKA